ncbi:MAG: alpha/beta fold hydrolase [Allosphingosinicella sp.]|uniref:alpha/beta fold hydrolase n=1 Tax=Allosphingosinicella sp. TaxID=2823234 RepID=UPI003939864D
MPETRTIALPHGRSLHAVTAGRGPDLLLIHGAVTTHRDWLAGPFDRLARHHRVTAVDRPGHGKSVRRRFEGSPHDQANQIVEGMDALGIGRTLIVGHSFGGTVALSLAERHPERVAGLVLIAPLAFPEPRPLEHLLIAPRALPVAGPAFSRLAEATFDRPLLEGVHMLMFSPQSPPPEWKAGYAYDEVLATGAMVAEGEDTAAIMPFSPEALIRHDRIEAPTHILTGTSDRVVNPAVHARPLARLIPNARLTELPGIGHMAHLCAADEMVAAIEEMGALAG